MSGSQRHDINRVATTQMACEIPVDYQSYISYGRVIIYVIAAYDSIFNRAKQSIAEVTTSQHNDWYVKYQCAGRLIRISLCSILSTIWLVPSFI